MGRAAEIAKKDTETAYVPRIRRLVEEDKVGAARKLVEEALRENPDEPYLAYWKEVLSPARFLGVNPARDFDRSAEIRWLEEHWPEYRGEWVALLGEELLAHGTLKEVSARLDKEFPGAPVLLEYIEPGE